MSQLVCATSNCKRIARALCHCCNRNICLLHLKEHNDAFLSQLNPCADEINSVDYRLVSIDAQVLLQEYHKQLEEWRKASYKTIDQIFEEKSKELERILIEKIDKQKIEINLVRDTITKLNEEAEASQLDVDLIKTKISRLNENLTNIEQISFKINTYPLIIDNNAVQIEEKKDLQTILSSPFKTIDFTDLGSPIIASNNKYLLLHQNSYLCLIDNEFKIFKKIPWHLKQIHDICWSSALDRFILTTETCGICYVHENSISLQDVECLTRQRFFSCSCSNTSLFLTTDTVGSSIIEFCLLPTIELSRQWQSPDTCTKDEYINRIRYSHGTLGLVIQNLTENTLKIELRCSKTLDRFWSIPLSSGLKLKQYEYCVFNDCQWLFIDRISSSILHITNDEKIKQTCNYNSKLCNVALFGTDILAVLTDKCIHFHKL
ncbi:unnamed protein product [Rotaria socialis]|uniref:Uncharacterized protein n=1 Tax=Rotaria socialis TaxID=392032 RepID=A0A821MF04_9BILA|nr:unnamed protein product [Rotaria socialis]CAF4765640.1 unnamed protein product [Rotaria socialis]